MSTEEKAPVRHVPNRADLLRTGKSAVGCCGNVVNQFRDFLLRGNVVDLAVAIVIGTAFTAVVKALVADIITPLIAAIFGGSNFGDLYFTVHHSKFMYGDLINNVISFLVLATIVFFLVVLPTQSLLDHYFPKKPKATCPTCLEEVHEGALRCKWCTSEISPETLLPAYDTRGNAPTDAKKPSVANV